MAGGVRERGNDDDLEENHEINVTPFIDVILVLLIIFMVAAPLATVDVHVDLPASTARPQERPDKPLYLTLKTDLSLNLGNDPVPREQLGLSLDHASENKKDTRIFLRADKGVDYGEFMLVMNLLRDAGYLKIALVGLETVPQPIAEPAAAGTVGTDVPASLAPVPGGVTP
ncbi:MAG: TonB system transport protein ExbD [Pseudomonadota bacterium]